MKSPRNLRAYIKYTALYAIDIICRPPILVLVEVVNFHKIKRENEEKNRKNANLRKITGNWAKFCAKYKKWTFVLFCFEIWNGKSKLMASKSVIVEIIACIAIVSFLFDRTIFLSFFILRLSCNLNFKYVLMFRKRRRFWPWIGNRRETKI